MLALNRRLMENWINKTWNLEDWNDKMWNLEGQFCILALLLLLCYVIDSQLLATKGWHIDSH